jgi:hypothetical protein
MVLARIVILLLLLSAAVSFGLFALTGQQRYKRFGMNIIKGTMIAGFTFFAVLIVQHLS